MQLSHKVFFLLLIWMSQAMQLKILSHQFILFTRIHRKGILMDHVLSWLQRRIFLRWKVFSNFCDQLPHPLDQKTSCPKDQRINIHHRRFSPPC